MSKESCKSCLIKKQYNRIHSLTKGTIMIKIGLIGYGYWGPNLARNFHFNNDLELIAICDFSSDRLKAACKLYPQVDCYDNVDDFFANTDMDAVAIATPVGTHFELAKRAIESGRHLWLEKPMTETVEQGRAADQAGQKEKKGAPR